MGLSFCIMISHLQPRWALISLRTLSKKLLVFFLEGVIIGDLQKKYPGISIEKITDNKWKVIIPKKYHIGHEAHFAQVTEKYLGYLVDGKLPDWEVPNMIAKYYTTTQALKKVRE